MPGPRPTDGAEPARRRQPNVSDEPILNWLEGENWAEDSVRGPRAGRAALVPGLEGPEEFRLAAAIQAPGIPKIGDSHPALPQLPCSIALFAPTANISSGNSSL